MTRLSKLIIVAAAVLSIGSTAIIVVATAGMFEYIYQNGLHAFVERVWEWKK